MSVNFAGNAVVRLSMVFAMNDQLGIVDRWLSALNLTPGVLWNSTALFAQMVIDGLPVTVKLAVSNDATLLGFKLYYKPPAAPPDIDRDASQAGICAGGAGQLPAQNCGLIRFSSNLSGAQGHGRMYFPFPYTAAVGADGLLSVGYAGALRDVHQAMTPGWIIPNSGLGGGTVTVYPCTKYTLPVSGLAIRMGGASVADGFATQRRRGFFGKPNSPNL